MPAKKTCFVVMGFGEKTDYETQRTLDLDKTYRGIIKPAVEDCGVECIRADEVIHSGVIDKPMYERLLDADLVIADLSTSNKNAIYELGVRHALRPNTTIVIAEDSFSFPFDLGHVVIRKYKHLGKGIDFEEVDRMRKLLIDAIKKLVFTDALIDSPVYTFLPGLSGPVLREMQEAVAAAGVADAGADGIVFGALLENAQQAMGQEEFEKAKLLFRKLHEMNKADEYAAQQLALATYKAPQKDEAGTRQALLDAHRILEENLDPESTNDPETLGLWGAVHKRLWELDRKREYLDQAVWSYERGFYLKRDYYNGINYAFMLNVRARIQEDGDEATADRVLAKRVRSDVLKLVSGAARQLPRAPDGRPEDPAEAYWMSATRLEALLGLGKHDELDAEANALFANAPSPWMPDSTRQQLDALRKLL